MTEEKQTKKEEVAQEAEVVEATQVTAVKHTPPWPIITVAVFITVVVLALFAAGWAWVGGIVHKTALQEAAQSSRSTQRGLYGSQNSGMMPRENTRTMITPAASGVIIKIDGDTITIAGQGKQVTVKKTSDTVVSGDKTSLTVNDTVLVAGDTADDGSVTATRIQVRNESIQERGFQGRQARPNA